MANTLTSLMKIVKSGTAGRIGGTIVDTFTAGRILAKYKGLTTDVSKRKFASLSVKEMSDFKIASPGKGKLRDQENPEVLGYELDRTTLTPKRNKVDTSKSGDYGADPVGDGTFRMVPSGDIVSFEERNRRLKSAKVKSAKSKRVAASTNEMVENFCFEIEELIGGNTIHQKDPLAVEAKDALDDLNDAVYKAVERYDGTINGLFRKKNDDDAEYDQGLRDMRED